MGEAFVRVDPRHYEGCKSLIDGELDEALCRCEIEDVVLVDPWRHDEKGDLAHLVGRWRVLDELEEVVLEDDVAGGDRKSPADLKGRHVGLTDLQEIAGLLHVLD